MLELNDDQDGNVPDRMNSGRAGLYLSLVAPLVLVGMSLLHPG